MSRPRIITVYQSPGNGQWYWRATAGGNIVEVSGESYTLEKDCERAVDAKLAATYARRKRPVRRLEKESLQ